MAAGSQSAPLCVNIILMDSKLVGMGALIGDITVCIYSVYTLVYYRVSISIRPGASSI